MNTFFQRKLQLNKIPIFADNLYMKKSIFISVILITQKFRKILRFAQDDTDGVQDGTDCTQDYADDGGISGKA